jgi:hypothetical protein
MSEPTLPTTCPRCQSANTVYLADPDVATCLNCDLDWWWSVDDGRVVTSGADQA